MQLGRKCFGIVTTFTLLLIVSGDLFSADQLLGTEPTRSDKAARPIVIVHGAWGGGHQWKKVADHLIKTGHADVYRVTLTGHGNRVHLASPQVNLTTHIADVVNTISFEQLENVILIGHSYGGGVISGVADTIPEKLSELIYLDATVMENGESFLTLEPERAAKFTRRAQEAGDGWLIPVDWPSEFRDVPHPLATLSQPIVLKNPLSAKIPTCYWLFTDGKPTEKDIRIKYYQRAKERKWNVRTFSWGHNPQHNRPMELAEALHESLLE